MMHFGNGDKLNCHSSSHKPRQIWRRYVAQCHVTMSVHWCRLHRTAGALNAGKVHSCMPTTITAFVPRPYKLTTA